MPIFYVVGLLFALFGGLMLWASSEVQELAIDYTNCANDAPEVEPANGDSLGSSRVTAHLSTSTAANAENEAISRVKWSRQNIQVGYGNGNYKLATSQCTLQFYIPNKINPPIFLYYRLSNFYQNHRRYVKSLEPDQLQGKYLSNSSIAGSTCDPLKTNENGVAYYPCGLIANSIFNDTIMSPTIITPQGQDQSVTYTMSNTSIGWSSDGDLYKKTAYKNYEVVPPPNWHLRYPNGTYNDEFPIPNIHEDESFWVWMRTAGLPTFSKLARKNLNDPLQIATYQIQIYDCQYQSNARSRWLLATP